MSESATHASGESAVVVRARPGAGAAVMARWERAGATNVTPLPLIDGFAATVPGSTLSTLRADSDVLAVVNDEVMSVQGTADGGGGRDKPSSYRRSIGADAAHANGLTGRGVTVALLDTGVSPARDLEGRMVEITDDRNGRRSDCVDFSGEDDCIDRYGHGTFLAGIIAGDGAQSAGEWTGVAPGANVLSVKVAGRNGAADVSTVLAAIQWVVSFRDRYDIRVLNLSLGTDSTESTLHDPLNYAVERAWHSGIVVVVAASNRGPDPRTISKPADDPWVITVGAVDDRGTPPVADDRLPAFSSRGPTVTDGWAKPDLVAPGAHIVSLRSDGSELDENFPASIQGAYRRGSGTSMSAAVVSGAVAVALQAHPSATPDMIKESLRLTARPAASNDPMAVGAGELAVDALAWRAPNGAANAGAPRSNGKGSLDGSRGASRVATGGVFPTVMTGVLTAQLLLWDPQGLVTNDWEMSTWYAGPASADLWQPVFWGGSNWGGSNWGGSNWGGSEWYGAEWYGQQDPSASYGETWLGGRWYGAWK